MSTAGQRIIARYPGENDRRDFSVSIRQNGY
jgi:hypothetical protein